jgi:hypothetical protein
MTEYLSARGMGQPAAAATSKSGSTGQSESVRQNLPPASGPGMRMTNRMLDSAAIQNSIGLRLADLPPLAPSSAELNYPELANLLAEAGLVGRLLNEINSGVLAARELTKSQKQLLDAVAQSGAWTARKNALREAERAAKNKFEALAQTQPDWLSKEFRFQPAADKNAFEEFVQFLHVQNVVYFDDKWQQVETAFGADAATALRDILNNYDDWYFLFGEPLEKK